MQRLKGDTMYLLKELVEIDKRFQSSVNLQLDLDNDIKLNSYIPTRSSLVILKEYLETVKNSKSFQSSILIGPYGKGKSHLLLVLLRILSESKNSRLSALISRIQKVDAELAKDIVGIRKSKKIFLPIIISSSNMSISESFLLGLTEALKRNHLDEVMPKSYYSEAIKTIENWKDNYSQTYEAFIRKLKEHHYHLAEFQKALRGMDEKALTVFREIYPTITAGSRFAPIINMDTMKLYEEVNCALCEKYHYAGMFLVFDEFSKYIEGHDTETFARDMKILQDLCELAAHSKEQQLHIVFVAHKSIKEYGNQLPKSVQNAFTGVEGRLKEVPFVVSGKNNFELVQDVIQKKSEASIRSILSNDEWKKCMEESYKIPCMSGLFEREEYNSIVQYGCFPLLPMTTYLLLAISEKVAQNERSVFTFLANDEQGSLVRMIEKSEEQAHGISADVVYDYFYSLFKEHTGLTRIHAEWLKAEYALSKATSADEVRVIKILALLKMLANPEEVPVIDKTLSVAAGIDEQRMKEIMKHLTDQQVVIWRAKLATYAFKNNVGVDLEQEMKHLIAKQNEAINECQILQEVSELEYILPKQHNQEYTMTRYFHYIYMTQKQFLSLPKSDYLFENQPADGKIVAIVGEQPDYEQLKEKLVQLADKRIVVIVPKEVLKQEDCLRRLLAVHQLQQDKNFVEANIVLEQELRIYEEDLVFELNAALEKLYLPENHRCYVLHDDLVLDQWSHAMEFNRMLSQICSDYYEHAPKINNEQINRKVITSQTKRARDQIIKEILSESTMDKYHQGTSPEATIFRATMFHTGIVNTENEIEAGSRYVLDRITEFIERCAGERHSFFELYETLLGRDCGARNGIIPIFIARQLARLEDTPVILLNHKEVEISPEILNNIDESPKDYFLFVEQQTVEKERYLQRLAKEFVPTQTESMSRHTRMQQIVVSMQRWYRSLPQMTLSFAVCPDNLGNAEFDYVLKLRRTFRGIEVNPHEMLFDKIPEIYEEFESYDDLVDSLLQTKEYLDRYLDYIRQRAVDVTKKVFWQNSEAGLFSVLKEWYEEQSEAAKCYLANNQVTAFMGYLNRMQTHNEAEIVSKLAKYILDLYIEDWKDDSLKSYEDELKSIKNSVENIHEELENSGNQNLISFVDSNGMKIEKYYDNVQEDSTSYFLKNAIEGALEEFGDTLEVNQKVAVLVQMLEKLTK